MSKFLLPYSLEEAKNIQEELKSRIILEDRIKLNELKFICGMDTGYKEGGIFGVVTLFHYPELEFIDFGVAYREKIDFPYIPTFLSFREGGILLEAYKNLVHKLNSSFNLSSKKIIFLCDGQGIAHPRRLGLASYIGITLQLPTIGVAKKPLLWKGVKIDTSKLKNRGDYSFLSYRSENLGVALITKDRVKPVFVSVGWGVSLKTAIKIVLNCSNYRIPEPIRLADKLSKKLCSK